MRHRIVTGVILAALVGLFVWQSLVFDFFQDDAYISYRFAANYLDGHGLVYNQGERVEGYTNFGWVLGLVVSGVLGFDYVLVSRVVGIGLASAAIILTFLLSRRCLAGSSPYWSLLPAALVSHNLSLAYWAQSGLESTAFVFLSALALYLYLCRSWLLIAVLVAAVLIRPEGALVAVLLVLLEILVRRQRPCYPLRSALIALAFTLPYLGFKLAYYGSILPNPFHAKTAFDIEQVEAGIAYAQTFIQHYPVLAAGFILLPVLWRRLNTDCWSLWLFTLGYAAYVVLIGGDVLMVHRFFLPVIVTLAIASSSAIALAARKLRVIFQYPLLIVSAVAMVYLGMALPNEYVTRYANLEKGLVIKMGFFAERLKEIGQGNFTVAASTIGRLGHDLRGHRIIDLLGLTDSTIARHPEPLPFSMESTWRERSFNSGYVLGQAPDFIVFSTGLKPSAPAERALLRYSQFLDCYRGAAWYFDPTDSLLTGQLVSLFGKVCEPEPPLTPVYPIEFVNYYTAGCNAMNSGKYHAAEDYFGRALELGGNPPYVYLLHRLSITSFQLNQDARGESLQNWVLEIDSTVAEVQGDLYVYEYIIGNEEKAATHRRWLESLWPWMVERYDSLARSRAEAWKAGQSRQ
ncbi:MAG: hypothetical protein AB1772_07255 [Candidatus Zixiibacteriota bacterium]